MKKRSLSILLALVMVLSLLPFAASAAKNDTVRVIAQNETFLEPSKDGGKPAWTGVLFDTEVQWTKGMTMESALTAAAKSEKVELAITDSSYGAFLSGVGGLLGNDYLYVDETKPEDDPYRATMGSWMLTLNDWFSDAGMSSTAVEPGDTVCAQYSTAYGADIGGDWASTDGRLSSLSFSAGALYPSFDPDVTEYDLYVPVDSVTVTPVAVNKNNKVTVLATGAEEAARWGARTVSVAKNDISVTVANGEKYQIKVIHNVGDHACTAFTDLADNWSRAGICWTVENGIMKGTGEKTFAPDGTTTRAMLATVLYRQSGEAKTDKSAGFKDVKSGDWFAEAVNWAAANKVVNGYEDKTFRPNQPVTREEAAAMLYRYCVTEDVKLTETLEGFQDAKDVQSWAKDAFCWAVQTGVINGMSADTLAPKGTATRAQLAAILWRTFGMNDDMQKALGYLLTQVPAPDCGAEWIVMNFARSQAWTTPGYDAYYSKVAAKAKETQGKMDAAYSTDISRYVLAVTAQGYDAADVGGYDLTALLQDTQAVVKQGVNGAIFALLALDSGKYPSTVRQDYINAILKAQKEDGGFTYNPKDPSDPDLTSMAIQALAPYMQAQEPVGAAVEKALACLSKMQQPNGGFTAWGESSCESTAQAILALNAAGVPLTSDDFVKDGHSLLDNLMSFQAANGGFRHVQDGDVSAYSSEQAVRALVDTYNAGHLGVSYYGVR